MARGANPRSRTRSSVPAAFTKARSPSKRRYSKRPRRESGSVKNR